jgi:hypothetical protein
MLKRSTHKEILTVANRLHTSIPATIVQILVISSIQATGSISFGANLGYEIVHKQSYKTLSKLCILYTEAKISLVPWHAISITMHVHIKSFCWFYSGEKPFRETNRVMIA